LVVFLFAAVITRTRLLKILDSVTIPGAAAFSVARVGCFLTGCCAGKETDLPWGVVFPNADSVSASLTNVHAVHPTQLYELILALIGSPLCLFIVKKAHAGEGSRFFVSSSCFLRFQSFRQSGKLNAELTSAFNLLFWYTAERRILQLRCFLEQLTFSFIYQGGFI